MIQKGAAIDANPRIGLRNVDKFRNKVYETVKPIFAKAIEDKLPGRAASAKASATDLLERMLAVTGS